MSLRSVSLTLLCLSLSCASALAWDGVDSSTGGNVEIGKGNLVRSGSSIEVYDHNAGGYRNVDVQSIRRYGSTVKVEVYDNDSGEYRTFDMDSE
ncbi:DUF5334 family protein [Neorhizobium galegae]|uniref:DUF5334 family protein n=1 Tax=Neorhizobium galegae TaxID=399 RepID=UPI0021058A9F|nr:DUF5334 family protein [Neorhizobium galegae]MCQ1839222.1 DUF5334 domain-containing protein [Neorhizobium galegae]